MNELARLRILEKFLITEMLDTKKATFNFDGIKTHFKNGHEIYARLEELTDGSKDDDEKTTCPICFEQVDKL